MLGYALPFGQETSWSLANMTCAQPRTCQIRNGVNDFCGPSGSRDMALSVVVDNFGHVLKRFENLWPNCAISGQVGLVWPFVGRLSKFQREVVRLGRSVNLGISVTPSAYRLVLAA